MFTMVVLPIGLGTHRVKEVFSSYEEAFEWFEAAKELVLASDGFCYAALMNEDGDFVHTACNNGDWD